MIDAFRKFERVLCIGCEDNLERREHARSEFRRVNVLNYDFVDAFEQNSESVLDLFQSDFVQKYPPCFRCGKDDCNCLNKSLFPAQVANWMSHMKAWRHVAAHDAQGLHLLCEDDVKFTDHVNEILSLIFESATVLGSMASERPVLVRLGWAWCADHEKNESPRLLKDIRMSNPCYAINGQMAHTLLNSLERIETTSDIYVHRLIGSRVDHFTAMPPAAYELSWSTGELKSEIRPKEVRIKYLQERLVRLTPDDPAYATVRKEIEEEQRKIMEFETFNARPRPNSFRR